MKPKVGQKVKAFNWERGLKEEGEIVEINSKSFWRFLVAFTPEDIATGDGLYYSEDEIEPLSKLEQALR